MTDATVSGPAQSAGLVRAPNGGLAKALCASCEPGWKAGGGVRSQV